MIGGDGDVRGALANHAEDRREHTPHRRNLSAGVIPDRRQRVVVAEQLVCAVDQMDVHTARFRRMSPLQ